MSYCYETEKKFIFTEEGQKTFLEIRDRVHKLLDQAGAFREDAIRIAGSTWETMACFDRLVELGEIVILRDKCWRQYRVYSTDEVHNR